MHGAVFHQNSCRQQRLEQLAAKFYKKAELRENWLTEMGKHLDELELGSTASDVEAALKKHQAISADILPRVRSRIRLWLIYILRVVVCVLLVPCLSNIQQVRGSAYERVLGRALQNPIQDVWRAVSGELLRVG